MEGIVFDIQRFGLHDGPGARTVVFLKGCPLSCKWCSNPESISKYPQLSYSAEKCNDSEKCFSTCPENVFSNYFWKARVDFDACKTCGKCIESCPTAALKIYGYSISGKEVIDIVKRDLEFYNNTGGGLTLSGGEPLFQFDFALDILKHAKTENLHTCIETSGFVKAGMLKQIMPYVDLFLFDYKLTNDTQHQYYTGVSNKEIRKNLNMILDAGKPVILRCILIPGVNDYKEHFKAIAHWSKRKNTEGVELMPYHEYGKHKYKQLGMEAFELGVKTTDRKLAEIWVEEIKKYGGKNIKLG
ncbi:glycyl-radical enzyme activating protein [uncultured Draconibacterium sp.]|uniref:glycyl-radical enzyme activating protein n=1 Tax=uncultured Draconibacterium sp. TaxID=1573823 RepID=UPI002D1E4AFE|nr:glycyl-radical enzyme activating protein [uncultured Draconibacterium sp.]